MELRPGYKRTEVGPIPVDWNVTCLGDIGEPLIGLTYKPSDVKTDGLLVLRSSNIADGTLRFEDKVFVDMDVPSKLIARKGDILICARNGSRDLIGKCAQIDERAQGMTFGAFMAVLRTPFHDFVYYQFQSNTIERQIHEHLGATINQITNKSLRSFRIPFPEHDGERRAVAAALGDVDALLGALTQLIAKKRDLKQSAMQALLTGKTRLPGFEIGRGYRTSDVGIIPQDWDTPQVHRMGDVKAGKALNANGPGSHRPYLRTKNVLDGRIDLGDVLSMPMTDSEFLHFGLRHGDVLLNEGQSLELVGRCSPYRGEYGGACAIQNQLLRFRAAGGVSPEFAAHLFRYCQQTGIFAQIATQTTSVAHLGVSRLQNLQLAWPSDLQEQEAIAVALSDMDAEIAGLELRRDKTRAIKQGMMQELLTGRTRLV